MNVAFTTCPNRCSRLVHDMSREINGPSVGRVLRDDLKSVDGVNNAVVIFRSTLAAKNGDCEESFHECVSLLLEIYENRITWFNV